MKGSEYRGCVSKQGILPLGVWAAHIYASQRFLLAVLVESQEYLYQRQPLTRWVVSGALPLSASFSVAAVSKRGFCTVMKYEFAKGVCSKTLYPKQFDHYSCLYRQDSSLTAIFLAIKTWGPTVVCSVVQSCHGYWPLPSQWQKPALMYSTGCQNFYCVRINVPTAKMVKPESPMAKKTGSIFEGMGVPAGKRLPQLGH